MARVKSPLLLSVLLLTALLALAGCGGDKPAEKPAAQSAAPAPEPAMAEEDKGDMEEPDGPEMAEKEDDVRSGEEIFATMCVACHGPGGVGGAVGPSLTDAETLLLGKDGHTIKSVIENGSPNNPTMIAWKTSLSPAEIEAVAAYVEGLSK